MNWNPFYAAIANRLDRDRKRAAQVAQSRASQPRRRDTKKGRRP